MNILKDYVESICHIRNRTAVSMSDLTSLIEDLRLGTATTEAPAQPSPPPAPKEAADDELAGFRIESTTVEKQQVPARSADPPPPTPKSGKIPPPPPEPKVEAPAAAPEQAPPEPNPPPAPVQEEPESSRGEQETAREKQNIPLSLTFAGLKKPSEEPQLPDLNTMIPDDQRQRFIRKVFRRDEKYYMGIIAALNKTRNWKEASHYLNKLYQVNRFDPFAKEIVEFTDAIQKRYEPTGKHP
jgi:hypothetical protein